MKNFDKGMKTFSKAVDSFSKGMGEYEKDAVRDNPKRRKRPKKSYNKNNVKIFSDKKNNVKIFSDKKFKL